MSVIYFYRAENAYGCFSNFSNDSVWLKDQKWKTTEHYFQAQKFAGTPMEEKIRMVKSARKSKKLGGTREVPIRSDWEQVKNGIMRDALVAKFTQHQHLRDVLLSTGGSKLVEHTTNDHYWGDGGDGSGKNMLGKLLMSVRDQLRDTPISESIVMEHTNEEGTEVSEEEEGEEEEVGSSNDETVQQVQQQQQSFSSYDPKRPVRAKTAKARRRRGVYLDADGSSKLEKNAEQQGTVSIVSESIVIPESALPSAAKVVVHRNQWRRKWQSTEKDFEDEEEGEEEEDDELSNVYRAQPLHSLAEYMQPTSTSTSNATPSQPFLTSSAESIWLSPQTCIETSKNIIELLKQLPKDAKLIQMCWEAKGALESFISQSTDEVQLAELLQLFESISTVVETNMATL